MSASGLTDVRIVIAAFVATAVLSLTAALMAPTSGPGAESPTSFSAAPAGGKAAFLTLRALGYGVERSFEPMTGVRAEPKDSVLVLTGALSPSDQDKRALLAFVTSGGVALVAGVSGAEFLGIEDLHAGRAGSGSPILTHRVWTPSPIVTGVTEITMSTLGEPVTFDPAYVAVFAETDRQPLVTTAVLGAGRVVWLAAPTPLMNGHIADADNLRLLLNVVGPARERQVLWDEHYHGHTRSLWSYAVNTPLPWIAAQLGLVAVSAFVALGRRSAPARPRRTSPRTSPLEFIEMLSTLYRRSNAAAAAVGAARGRFVRAVASVSGVQPGRGDDAVARAAALKLDMNPQVVADSLSASAEPARETLDPKAAVALTARLQKLTARLYALRTQQGPVSAGHQE